MKTRLFLDRDGTMQRTELMVGDRFVFDKEKLILTANRNGEPLHFCPDDISSVKSVVALKSEMLIFYLKLVGINVQEVRDADCPRDKWVCEVVRRDKRWLPK